MTVKAEHHILQITKAFKDLRGSFHHISPVLQGLHWLPIKSSLVFKVPLYSLKAIHDLAPSYPADLLYVALTKHPKYQLSSSVQI